MKKSLEQTIESAENILIIQADNPDGDSLASTLALEAILSEMDKKSTLYCGVNIPTYLRYMNGWDRVMHNLPHGFDLSIIVDTASLLLLESLQKSGEIKWLKTKPCIVIDHHATESTIDFATAEYIEPAVSTGELIYKLTKRSGWPLPLDAAEHIVNSIMSDSLGLISESTSSETVKIVAKLMEMGVSLAKQDARRREYQKKQPELLGYKGDLLKRVGYDSSRQVAHLSIPWEEIEKYSPLYNPSMLAIDEMRQVENVKVAVVFKSYPDGRITAKLRSNYGFPVCDKVAEKFGGGGHPYASGFRVTDKTALKDVRSKCFEIILDELKALPA
jgi:phosphoesterase RecJ-like protein